MRQTSPIRGRWHEVPERERCQRSWLREREINQLLLNSRLSPPPPAAEPLAEGPRGERTFFDSLRLCSGLLMSTILHPRSTASQVAKWKGLLITCKNSSRSISINSCCCNFIFDFLLCSLRDPLDCQGDGSRCYSISKLSQMLYAFIADSNPILLPVPSPAFLR